MCLSLTVEVYTVLRGSLHGGLQRFWVYHDLARACSERKPREREPVRALFL